MNAVQMRKALRVLGHHGFTIKDEGDDVPLPPGLDVTSEQLATALAEAEDQERRAAIHARADELVEGLVDPRQQRADLMVGVLTLYQELVRHGLISADANERLAPLLDKALQVQRIREDAATLAADPTKTAADLTTAAQ